MKVIHAPLTLAAALFGALALSACGKHHATTSPIPSTPPPSATAEAPAAAASARTSTNHAPTTISLSSLQLGSKVNAHGRILAVGSTFAPTDSIHVSVETVGEGSALLSARWTDQDGRVLAEDSRTLHADVMGPQTSTFMISQPGGLAAGRYTVEILLNGKAFASKDFTVQASNGRGARRDRPGHSR